MSTETRNIEFNVNLNGRTALITGSTASSSGIGYAIAKRLAEASASVVVTGRTEERVTTATEQLEADLRGAGRTVAGDRARRRSESRYE